MKSNTKIGLGVIGEKFNNSVAKSIFKVKEDYRVKHVDWDNYSYGHGLDLRVFKRNKQVMAVEVKNWRKMNRPYGTETAKTEIIDRFKNYAGGIKLLILTFISLLTQKALWLLKVHDIHVIEVGKLIGKKAFKSKLFYQIKRKIERVWLENRNKPARFVHGIQVRLDSLSVNTSNDIIRDIDKQAYNIISNKHDTNLEKQSIKQTNKHQTEHIDEDKQGDKG